LTKVKKECFNILKDGNMLKKAIIILFLFVIAIGNLLAETLTIQIENADIGKGYLMVGIFNDESTFPDTYFRGERIAVSERTVAVTFTNLPKGQYAVSVYQDSNSNEQLDKNIFGIPKEKYGFSNDSDRPNYRRCLFNFNEDMVITIRLR
jgi:uncharacterized protein (DUF2141 family)